MGDQKALICICMWVSVGVHVCVRAKTACRGHAALTLAHSLLPLLLCFSAAEQGGHPGPSPLQVLYWFL